MVCLLANDKKKASMMQLYPAKQAEQLSFAYKIIFCLYYFTNSNWSCHRNGHRFPALLDSLPPLLLGRLDGKGLSSPDSVMGENMR